MKARTGWSTSGTLVTVQGSQLGTEVSANPQGNQVTLQVDFSEAGASEFTVQFNIQPVDVPTTPSPRVLYMAEALVEMSIAGNTVMRRVSIINGTTLSGIAESVRVVVWDTTPKVGLYAPHTLPFVVGLRYSISVNVARGGRPTSAVPPSLVPPLGITFFPAFQFLANVNVPGNYLPAGSGSPAELIIPIPYDAGVIGAFLTLQSDAFNPTDPNGTYGAVQASWGTRWVDGTFNFNENATWSVADNLSTWVPMAPGCNALIITQVGASMDSALEVGVSLTIDG